MLPFYAEDELVGEVSRIFEEADRLAAHFEPGGVVAVPDSVDVLAIRRSLGLSRQALADKIGVDVGTLRKWESGTRQPDASARVLLSMVAADADVVGRTLALLDLRTGRVAMPGRPAPA